MSTPAHLYLCSSVRHAYLAMGLANDAPDIDHHLIFVGQHKPEHNHTIQLFLHDNKPFASVEVFTDNKGPISKYRSKQVAFARLESVLTQLQPSKIVAGNDRRVEFQYAMHYCQQQHMPVIGAYLDDGTASYINGRYIRKIRAATDLTVDRALKRLFYGRWYDKHLLMGGTRYVDECYLNLPYLAPQALQDSKRIIALVPETFRNERFLALAQRFIDRAVEQSQQDQAAGVGGVGGEHIFEQAYDAFVTLPMSKFVETSFPSMQYYIDKVNAYLANFERVAIKYHPREDNFYFKTDANVTVFPGSIPAEVIFSFVKTDCVIGDLSSALLSAVWLLPNCRAICLCPGALEHSPVMKIVKQTPVEIELC